MKMKTGEIVGLHLAIQKIKETTLPSTALPVKFAYALQMNLKNTESVFESFKSFADPMKVPVIEAFETDRKAELEKICDRDANGQPIINNQEYVISDTSKISSLKDVLAVTHPEAEAAYAKLNADIEALSNEVVEINLHLIPLDYLPETMTLTMIDAIFPMIKPEA